MVLRYPAFLVPLLATGLLGAEPKSDCPRVVTDAIAKAFPKSTITTCVAEKEHGHDQFEVKLVRDGGAKAEIDVAPDGTILQIEEKIALDKVPAAVMKAFAAKYPKATVETAEKQTPTKGAASYELAFTIDGHRKEVTFSEAGKVLEEE